MTSNAGGPDLNVAQFLRSLLRRPAALAFLAIITMIAGYVGWSSTSSVYQSTAVAVVIPPGSGSLDAGLNPLINLNTNMAQLTAVVATALQSDGGHRAAKEAGGTGNFTVNTTFGDQAVFAQLTSQLVIVADGTTPDSARSAAAALVEYARSCLNKIQLDSAVPVENNALLIPSVEPSQAVTLPTSAVRAAAAYALGALLGGVALLLLFDAARELSRRWRRHGAHAAENQWPAADDDDEGASDAEATDLDGASRSDAHC
ncbi:hypothetical protein [Mycobacterium hubeiense]|uniref:hypothetical protein n=1 Tax=Mycobacterium hubeiense TaxID=1867256 RepID=UPI001E2E7A83|nr:hypothetical protein [Mycobacterium sp. QGD 101]